MEGVVPAEINVYEDRTFSFILKTPPASSLILKAIGVEKGAGKPPAQKVGTITRKQLEEIAQIKMVDLNANDLKSAVKIIAGTCRSMGVDVGDKNKGGLALQPDRRTKISIRPLRFPSFSS